MPEVTGTIRRVRRLAILLLLLTACAKSRPPVILISIDTLRADRVTPAITPHIHELASEATVNTVAWSHCPLTLPSHASIFTGLLPPEHGVRDNAGYRLDGAHHPTLASILRANGYRTGGAVSAYVLRADTGVAAGFDDYDDAIGMVDGAATGSLQRNGRAATEIAQRWIAAHQNEPFFYFLHLYEPHTPHAQSYDGDVRDADALVGSFMKFLKEHSIYDRAIVVLVSDHGEGLNDHGEEEHGVFLYREALEVPLIVKLPGEAKPKRIDSGVQLIDVLPTILDAVGIEPPKGIRGTSLLEDVPARTLYAESLYPRLHLGWSELRSVVRAPMQFIEAPRPELYDFARDPAQRRNLAAAERRVVHDLRAQLASFGATFTAPAAIDAEESKKLAALGYVSAGTNDAPSHIDPKDRIADLARLKHAGSIAEMESLLAANPQWSDVRDQLGNALAANGDHEKAAQIYEAGITATPKLAPVFALSAATEWFELDRNDAAEKHARFAASSGIDEAHLLLGELALARGDLESATREAEIASRGASRIVHAIFLQARIASARRDFAGALDLLGRAQTEQRRTGASLPRHFHYAAGDALARLGRLDEARGAFAKEIASDPRNLDAYTHLASILRIAGDPTRADAVLAQMVRVNPTAKARELAKTMAK